MEMKLYFQILVCDLRVLAFSFYRKLPNRGTDTFLKLYGSGPKLIKSIIDEWVQRKNTGFFFFHKNTFIYIGVLTFRSIITFYLLSTYRLLKTCYYC